MVARDSREYEIRHKLTKLVLFVCILVFLFPEYSKGEKPEDCKPGLQYWSEGKDDHSIVAGPHCVGCPRTLANCEEQPINDRKSCHDSCGKTGKQGKSSTTLRHSTTIPHSTTIRHSTTSNETPGSKTVDPTGVHRNDSNELGNAVEKPVDEEKKNSNSSKALALWVLIAILCLAAVVSLVVLLVLLLRRRDRRRGVQDLTGGAAVEEENIPLHVLPSEAPAPSAPADTSRDTIAGNEDMTNYVSSFNLPEDCS